MTEITIAYDNHAVLPEMDVDWGFSCVIKTPYSTILFDTGGDGAILLKNLTSLGFKAGDIQSVVLSHKHDDHTGGLLDLWNLNDKVDIYALPSTVAELRGKLPLRARWNVVEEPVEISKGIWTTGSQGSKLTEQSLSVKGKSGQTLITGCAHPGIAGIVSSVAAHGSVYLVIGGFHLKDMSIEASLDVVRELKAFGVQRIAPCHCTGDTALEQFQLEFGSEFIGAGVGSVFQVD